MTKIVVTIWRGVIADVTGLKKGQKLYIRDYDPEAYEDQELEKDADGDEYKEFEFIGGE